MKGLPPQPAPGLTITDGTPVTFAAAFAPLRPHVGAAVTLRLATAVGGLRAGEHAVTILDWSTLDADARSGFAESNSSRWPPASAAPGASAWRPSRSSAASRTRCLPTSSISRPTAC